MGNLISGKEAWISKSEGKCVQYSLGGLSWCDLTDNEFKHWSSERFLDNNLNYKFRLKPKTVNLNGVEVGGLASSQWSASEPNKVKLKFNSKDEAHYFYTKAMEIFKNGKGK